MLLKLLEIGTAIALVFSIISIFVFLYITVEEYALEQKNIKLSSNRDDWFAPGGHLYEEE